MHPPNETAAPPPGSHSRDLHWMERALELARMGTALASPNPRVGCVLVSPDGRCVGEGWHSYDQRDHAEIVALRAAGEQARGATAYVTLEPCSHTGRTGPCALALQHAGVARVVVATEDPNPRVAGNGLRMLREAGIAVDCGTGLHAARRLNEGFARWIQTGMPFVTQKVALSLDGRIAPQPGLLGQGPFWITSEESRFTVQQMRHAADAVLTGIGTILADDPLLTDRSGAPRRRNLLRVILDSTLRLPLAAQLVQSADGDVVVCTVSQDEERVALLRGLGVEVQQFSPGVHGRLPLASVLEWLGQRQILDVMTECGSHLNGALLSEGLVDRCTCFVAPVILGAHALPAWGTRDAAGATAAGHLSGMLSPSARPDAGPNMIPEAPSNVHPNAAESIQLPQARWSASGPDACCSALLCDPWPAEPVD